MPQFEFFCFRWTGLGWSGRGSGRVDLHDFNYSPATFLLFDLDQHCRTGRDANITRRLEHRDVQKGIANTFKFNETELLVQFEPAYSTARNHARFPIWTAPTRLRLGSFNERRQIRNRQRRSVTVVCTET